jgi:hypothetical protein
MGFSGCGWAGFRSEKAARQSWRLVRKGETKKGFKATAG